MPQDERPGALQHVERCRYLPSISTCGQAGQEHGRVVAACRHRQTSEDLAIEGEYTPRIRVDQGAVRGRVSPELKQGAVEAQPEALARKRHLRKRTKLFSYPNKALIFTIICEARRQIS